jgi:hypothetical protein
MSTANDVGTKAKETGVERRLGGGKGMGGGHSL